jgi:aminoglycoside phosphotransferase (APT) family kinase protein
MGTLLAAIHAVPPSQLTGSADIDVTTLDGWQEQAAQLYPKVAQHLQPQYQWAVEAILDSSPPAPPSRPVFSHHDLGIEHVLVKMNSGKVTGVIDWSDAAIGDPAHDFGLILRDLGPPALDIALSAYGVGNEDVAQLRERATFYGRCGTIEDFA